MTKPNSTEVVFIVDRSGSMQSIVSDMVGGFSEFIRSQRELPGECKVSMFQFDDYYTCVYQGVDVNDVKELELKPRGCTALYDAVGKTITDVGARLAGTPEDERPSSVNFVIITDGYENASREYTANKIKKMIEHQKEKYSWTFTFLGANQDAVTSAQTIGIQSSSAITYDASSVGASKLFRGLSYAVTNSRLTGDHMTYDQATYDTAPLIKVTK